MYILTNINGSNRGSSLITRIVIDQGQLADLGNAKYHGHELVFIQAMTSPSLRNIECIDIFIIDIIAIYATCKNII